MFLSVYNYGLRTNNMIDPFICELDDIFWTSSRIMKIPDGYRTIEKTGIVRSPSLLHRHSPHSTLALSLRSSMHKSGPYQLLDPSSQKILITKYDIMGASPARNTIQCLCRGLSDVAGSREKYRPRWDRMNVRHAGRRAGLLQRWPAGSRGRWFGNTGPRFDPRF